jgi:hypothetical protein
MQLVSRIALNLLIIGAVAFVLVASAASAQEYTPDAEDLTVEASDTTPSPGESVTIFAKVTDSEGDGVANTEVTFTITSNPGDAEFANGGQSTMEHTNDEGQASVVLNTGATPGTIVVRVDGAGEVSQVTVTTGSPQSLPKTGSQPLSDGSLPLTAAALAAMGLALLASAALGFRKLTRRSVRGNEDQYYI